MGSKPSKQEGKVLTPTFHRKGKTPQIIRDEPMDDTIKARDVTDFSIKEGGGFCMYGVESRENSELMLKTADIILDNSPKLNQPKEIEQEISPDIKVVESKTSYKMDLKPFTKFTFLSNGRKETSTTLSINNEEQNKQGQINSGSPPRMNPNVNPIRNYSSEKKIESITSGSTKSVTVTQLEHEVNSEVSFPLMSSYFYGLYTCTNCGNEWNSRIAQNNVGRACIKCGTTIMPVRG